MRLISICCNVHKIKSLIFVYKYTLYALLTDAVGERVRMIYTDTDTFVFHFFVKHLAKTINARPHISDAIDFNKISNGHLFKFERRNADLHAGEVGYFKNETKSNPIVENVCLHPKIYTFTVCDASEHIPGVNNQIVVRHKAVAKNVARSQIKRFKHEYYVACTMVEP